MTRRREKPMAKMRKKKKLNIVFVASEAVPFCKTGGLADVAGSLASALADRGHNVSLFVPMYRQVDIKAHRIKPTGVSVKVPISARIVRGSILKTKRGRLSVYFVENADYFDRERLYNTSAGDYADNAERFIFFSMAVLETVAKLKLDPDIFHVNDWQTALIPAYLKTRYAGDPSMANAATLLTIHNLGYQGLFTPEKWHLTGLSWELYSSGIMEFYGKINFLKSGLLFSDILATVSETYAREILSPEDGWGLDGVLRDRADDLFGVVNGIDTHEWDPRTDQLIPANFTSNDLEGKKVCKESLLKEMGLSCADEPVAGVVSRLAEQKGMDILLECADDILDSGVNLALLGSGDSRLEEEFRKVGKRHPGKAAINIGFSEILAHKIIAASDILIVPSRYEPCGLTQMYALAYGAAPVVRATGGLNDTVSQVDPGADIGNGFKFTDYSPKALAEKIMETVDFYRRFPLKWTRIISRGMNEDHSWAKSAGRYESLYDRATTNGISK